MMKHIFTTALLCAGLSPCLVNAQEVDSLMYPDYADDYPVDYSLLKHGSNSTTRVLGGAKAGDELPDHFNNAELMYFPPIFNQHGGSCGSASSVAYMFTYEMNSYRNADASLPENQYPTHFTWLFTYGNSSKDAMLLHNGVPNVTVYGGRTYSSIFGPQTADRNDFGWMQGYDKWFHAMHNRAAQGFKFPVNVGSEEGRLALKHWLYNHNGDSDMNGGGLAGIGLASGGKWDPIPSSPTNNEIGVTGKKYVKRWGTKYDHALTVVGYDDRIEFDLNGNGIMGEKDADEVGAWIIANSWGNRWCNNGFIYCPYAYAGTGFKELGNGEFEFNNSWWRPFVSKVRKNYRPLRTIKVEMDYSRRSEICLSAGISTDLKATMPSKTIQFEHFKYAGDGNKGNTQPAPEIPMLGRWADGKLHTEPMEFGYDLTDLSAGYDRNTPVKYFFIVETRNWAEGTGKIHHASIINYEFNKNGEEVPFNLNGDGVEIKNHGNKTIISTIVYGDCYYAPYNLTINGNQLTWNKPIPSGHKIDAYKIFCNNKEIAHVAGDVLNYTLPQHYEEGTYEVCAVYEDGIASEKIATQTPVATQTENMLVEFNHSGFVIPDVFDTHYNAATIEFWIRPHTLTDFNQSFGPGAGKFMFHTDASGKIYTGWADNHKVVSNPGALKKNVWTHVAITINGNALALFIDGRQVRSFYSSAFKGIGGFGDFPFNLAPAENSIDADIDEIRIWDCARSSLQLNNNKKAEFTGKILPQHLIAYYRGHLNSHEGETYLQDGVASNHALILNGNYASSVNKDLQFSKPFGNPSTKIISGTDAIITNIPTQLSANYSDVVCDLKWTIPGANVKHLSMVSPTVIFTQSGKQKILLEAVTYDGNSLKDSCEINVAESPVADASFIISDSVVAAGQTVCFTPEHPVLGYGYTWSMPGADKVKAGTINASTTYSTKGKYTVTLTVTDGEGKQVSSSKQISVEEIAPIANFEIAPKVLLKGETTFLNDKSKFTPTSWKWILRGKDHNIAFSGESSSFTPTTPGIYDVQLLVKNNKGYSSKTEERAIVVCNADSKNGLLLADKAKVTLQSSPFSNSQRAFTIDWWMNPTQLEANSMGIGESAQTFLLRTNEKGGMEMFIENKKCFTTDNFVIPGEWHHYAVTFASGRATFYRDGVMIGRRAPGRTSVKAVNNFAISGDEHPFHGQIDEFRIWNKSLSEATIRSYANSPIDNVEKAETEGLQLYYNFNQDGGDVIDLTKNHNDGVRTDFGPDGDAWGLSTGVFSLNLGEKISTEDVIANYLKNFKAPFTFDEQPIHTSGSYKHITDWTLENTNVQGDITTGVFVNKNKDNNLCYINGWDNFSALKNHKCYQTVTLPAGFYTFAINYGMYEGNCQDAYLVVAEGKGLPNTDKLNGAIANCKLQPKGKNTTAGSVQFLLTEETEVSLGLLINTTETGTCTFESFSLTRDNVKVIEADGANGFDLTIDNSGYNTLYLPYATVIPEGVSVYTATEVKGSEICFDPIAGKIIPAKTGVVVMAKAGEYHFKPSTVSSNATSLLSGVTTDTEADMSKRYYTFDAQPQPGFYLDNSSTLAANKAFYESDGSDTNKVYTIHLVPVGIDQITTEGAAQQMYDISGRRVHTPAKGLYISNGKKILVK